MLDGVYAIGGFDGEKYLNSVERMDEKTGEWVDRVEGMKEARCTFGLVSS